VAGPFTMTDVIHGYDDDDCGGPVWYIP
jgi:hypothetical protein